MKKEKIAPLFLFLSALLWSLSGIFTKSVAWNGLCLATLRGVIAFLVSLILVRGRRIRLNRQKVLTAICYFVQSMLFMCANKYTTAANATVLQNTSPLYIILLNALLYKKRPRLPECVACGCLLFGVTLACAGNMSSGGGLGNALALLSAFFYAGVYFFSKTEGADPLESLFLGNALYLLIVPYCVMNETVRGTAASQWPFLLVFASLTGICAWLCFTVGIRYTGALQANFITMTEPVMAPLWTFLFLKERISPLSVVGCVVVVTTLIVYNVISIRASQMEEKTAG